MCTGAERAATCGRGAHIERSETPRSLSVMPEGSCGDQALGQAPNDLDGFGVGGQPGCGAPAGVQDGGVVASAEPGPDGGEGLAGVLTCEVHGDLARPGEARGPALGEELLAREPEGLGGEVLDGFHGGWRGSRAQGGGVELGEDLVGEL